LFLFKRVFPLKSIPVLLVLIFSIAVHAKTDAPVQIEKSPAWVVEKAVTVPEDIPADDIDNGVYYLHADNQIKVEDGKKTVFYSRFAEFVVNREGLEEVSQINLGYDPSYQKIVLHSLLIHRGDQRIDKTKTAKITLLQRESGLEEQLYDGHLTANIIVDDVRVGDIIEYSYTRIGTNPIYKGVFTYDRYVRWNIPVHYQSIRVLWGKSNPLRSKTLNTDAVIQARTLGRFKEYSLALTDTPPLLINSQVPKWYRPYGIVYFYEAENWSEIAAWAVSLYDNVTDGGKEIERIAKTIEADASTSEAKVSAALNYVQSNIRYLGIEMGTSSHMPSPANETLKRRYGDCKDKAVLFISILKALGVTAYPALVNTEIKQHVAKLPPMTDAFNHVIVKAVAGGKTYWLDPTRSYQIGNLENIYQPDYGYALVVDGTTRSLESMKNSAHLSRSVINETFDLTKGVGQEVLFESRTAYYGYAAEKQRYDLASRGVTSLQKQYLDFYSAYYPGIEARMNFESTDDRSSGVITQKEKYLIKNFWTKNDEEKEHTGQFYANSFAFDLSKPDQLNRNAPYVLSHPVEKAHTIKITFATDDWYFPDEKTVVDNKYFFVKSDTKYDAASRVLTLRLEYKSKADHVPADEIESYLKERSKALDLLEYGIVKPFSGQTAAATDTQSNVALLAVAAIVLIYLGGLLYIIISWRLDAKKQPSFPDACYYPVSLGKLIVLSVMSFGIYTCYWFYKNYAFKKHEDGNAIMPVARGLFYLFWYYPLYRTLSEDSAKRYQENRVLVQPLAVLFAVLFLLAGLLSNRDGLWAATGLALPLFLIPLANYINHINRHSPEAYAYHSRWKFRHTVMVLLSLPILLLVTAEETHLIPGDKVVKGDELMAYDIQYMHRNRIFPSEEKPLYFYSDALFMIRDDGNGFTDHYVFSYWKDDGRLNVEKEYFGNVKTIDVTYSEGIGENTIVKIVRKDGSDFILYVSSQDALDKVFVDRLRRQWKTVEAPKTR
jgi:transglutaminase-like putative cysteine protease